MLNNVSLQLSVFVVVVFVQICLFVLFLYPVMYAKKKILRAQSVLLLLF